MLVLDLLNYRFVEGHRRPLLNVRHIEPVDHYIVRFRLLYKLLEPL